MLPAGRAEWECSKSCSAVGGPSRNSPSTSDAGECSKSCSAVGGLSRNSPSTSDVGCRIAWGRWCQWCIQWRRWSSCWASAASIHQLRERSTAGCLNFLVETFEQQFRVKDIKVIFGLVDVSTNFCVNCDNTVTRWDSCKIMIEHCDNSAQKQFLSHRIAKVWNSLPAGVIDFTNLVSFRTSLQKINLRLFTRF